MILYNMELLSIFVYHILLLHFIPPENKKCDYRSSRTKNTNSDSRQTNSMWNGCTNTHKQWWNLRFYQIHIICVCRNKRIIPERKYTFFHIITLVWHNYDTTSVQRIQQFFADTIFLFSWYAILTENRKGCGNTQQRHRRASQPASNLGRITKESPCRSMGTDTIKKRTQTKFDLGSLWWRQQRLDLIKDALRQAVARGAHPRRIWLVRVLL